MGAAINIFQCILHLFTPHTPNKYTILKCQIYSHIYENIRNVTRLFSSIENDVFITI